MAYSVQKSRLAKVASVSLVMLLAACSSDSRYKRQVSGDESYLDATPLAELHAPAGMILPIQNGDYNIPVTNGSGRNFVPFKFFRGRLGFFNFVFILV